MAKKNKMKWYDWLAFLLLIVAGLNWGLVAFLNFNLVTFLFGKIVFLEKLVYGLVTVAGIYGAFSVFKLAGK